MSSKEKNTSQSEVNVKKENVSVLERIRRRTGLLVGIVGLALVIFILESLLGSGASIFGGDDLSNVGTINGAKIDRNEFTNRVEMQVNNYRQRGQQEVNDEMRGQIVQNVWSQYIAELVIKPQFEKAGIVVGEDELYDRVVVNPASSVIQQLTDPNTGKLSEQFAKPDGSLDLNKWRQAVQSVTGESEMAVKQMEDAVKSTRFFEKFRTLVNKGLYVTNAEAKASYNAQNTQYGISYAVKMFTTVNDSTVKFNDSDLEKYYSSHSYLYKNPTTSRKIEYVAFNVVASPEDIAAIEKEAQRVAEEFKGKSVRDDSSYMSQESENGNITIQNFDKKSMIIRDSSVFTAAPGTVFGPYNEGAYFKVYKLQAINSVADSAKVRHILVGINDPQTNQPKRTKERAKTEADSVLNLLNNKQADFNALVISYSDDMGSKSNGGDYGWFDENKGFVEPFKNAGLMGTKGNISVVETQFGYHIIEVLDVSKSRHNSYRVAQIFKAIAPSDETNQRIFAQASQFGGENNTGDLFDKAVESQKLTKRLADDIKEGDRSIGGGMITGAREMVRWIFDAKKGDVNVFSFNDKHVVAKLSGIKNKGVLPLEEVKDLVTAKVILQKKAEMFMEEFSSKASGVKTVEEIASKMGLESFKQENLNEQMNNIDRVGQDYVMVGTALGTKQNAVSKVTIGNNGVFVLGVNSINTMPAPADLSDMKVKLHGAITSRSDSQVFEALKEIADINNHTSRVD